MEARHEVQVVTEPAQVLQGEVHEMQLPATTKRVESMQVRQKEALEQVAQGDRQASQTRVLLLG